jgi:hypothetical protein
MVIGVRVEEARGTMTGVPAADAHPTKEAAKKPYTTLGFMLGKIPGVPNQPQLLKTSQ